MQISSLGQIFLEMQAIDHEKLTRAMQIQTERNISLEEALLSLGYIDEETIRRGLQLQEEKKMSVGGGEGKEPSSAPVLPVSEPVEPPESFTIDLTRGKTIGDYDRHELLSRDRFFFRLPSTNEVYQQVSDFLQDRLRQIDLPETEMMDLEMAFNEAMDNAMRHGNHYDPARRIAVEFHHDGQQILFSVEDEGEGFDHRAIFQRLQHSSAIEEARSRYLSGGMGGLGISLMQKCVDRLFYNDKGNKLTLIKKIQATAVTAEAQALPLEEETQIATSTFCTSLQYFEKMQWSKNFPLVVNLVADSLPPASRDLPAPVLQFVPVFPGCLCVPSYQRLPLSTIENQGKFWITPQTQDSWLDARVEIWQEGRLLHLFETPVTIVNSFLPRILLGLGIATVVLSPLLDAVDLPLKSDPTLFSYLAISLITTLGGLTSFGFGLGLMQILLALLLHWKNRAKEGKPLEIFLPYPGES